MKNRIIIYCYSLSGGAGRNVAIYANTISNHICPVTVICSHCEDKINRSLHSTIELRITNRSRNFYNIPTLIMATRELRPKLLFCIGESNSIIGAIALTLSFTKTLLVTRDTQDHISWLRHMNDVERRLKSWLASLSRRKAAKIISLCSEMKSRSLKMWKDNPSKYKIISNGVDLNEYKPSYEKKCINNKYTYLYVGRLEHQKSVDTLLRAFRIVELQKKQSRLVIVGAGSMGDRYKRLASSLSISNISWEGYKSNPDPYYASCDCFVLPSLYEGFPNVIIEAMSFGLDVVSTDCPTGPSDVLCGGKYGKLVSCQAPEEMACAMLEVRKEPADPAQIRRRAEDFSLSIKKNKIIDLFNKLVYKN